MTIVSFRNVYKRYDAFEMALRGISFDVRGGEFAALAGPSGSGKTTILNLAAGLDKPTRGMVTLLENDLNDLTRPQVTALRRENVGFIFQSFNLFPVLTAVENVQYPLAIQGINGKQGRQRALQALAEVGISDFAVRFPTELSGGQQQRVAIARAIVTQPQIIFADEPTANLDSKAAWQLLEVFQKLNEEKAITFLFSSHDPSVLKTAKRVLFISDGKFESGEKQEERLEIAA